MNCYTSVLFAEWPQLIERYFMFMVFLYPPRCKFSNYVTYCNFGLHAMVYDDGQAVKTLHDLYSTRLLAYIILKMLVHVFCKLHTVYLEQNNIITMSVKTLKCGLKKQDLSLKKMCCLGVEQRTYQSGIRTNDLRISVPVLIRSPKLQSVK